MSAVITMRALWRSPAYTVTAVATLALAVSLSSVTVAVVDGVLFKPLPYRNADRLFSVVGQDAARRVASLSADEVDHLRAADSRVALTAFHRVADVRASDQPQALLATMAIDRYFFEVLGQAPMVGGFAAEHYLVRSAPTEPQPALISHAWWRDGLGSDAGVLGRTVELVGTQIRVAGVLPRDFVAPDGAAPPSLLLALVDQTDPPQSRRSRGLSAVVRLSDDISTFQAQAVLDATFQADTTDANAALQRPGPYTAVLMRPLNGLLGAAERPFFRAAFVGSVLLMLLGCVNVASLLLARARDRQRELRVRAALGASRAKLAWHLVGEALLIAVAGAAVGLVLASPLLSAAVLMLPDTLGLLTPPAVDWRVALFAAGTTALTMAVVVWAGSHRMIEAAVAAGLSGTIVAVPPARPWGRQVLVAGQSAIGIALVAGGGLLVATFLQLRLQDPGLQRGLGVLEVIMPGAAPVEAQRAQHAKVLARLGAMPGVGGAARFGVPLLRNQIGGSSFAAPAGADRFFLAGIPVNDIPVAGDFFAIAGLALLDGRVLSATELEHGRPLAVVSESTARGYWPGQRAVGQTLTGDGRTVAVIGVVEDARVATLADGDAAGELYLPEAYGRRRWNVYLIDAQGDVVSTVREAAAAVTRDVAGVVVTRAEPLERALAHSVRLYAFRAALSGGAAASALLLLAVGLAGMTAMSVARRSREMAIRVALGAERRTVIQLIVRDELRPVVAGSACGLILAWWGTRALNAFLFQLDAHDPAVWMMAVALVLVVTAVAAWLPAYRASAVDPASTLRSD